MNEIDRLITALTYLKHIADKKHPPLETILEEISFKLGVTIRELKESKNKGLIN